MASECLDAAILRASTKLGYSSLRENQLKAIKSFLEGNDVFVILPTGSGKSLCFWLLPFAFDYLYERVDSIVIVVSPLIALMKDQVRNKLFLLSSFAPCSDWLLSLLCMSRCKTCR